MNAMRKWQKWVWTIVLVAVAGLTTSHSVRAEPQITPSPAVFRGSSGRYVRGLGAPDKMVRVRIATYDATTIDVRMSKLDHFGQYLEALEMMEQGRQASFAHRRVDLADHSGLRFEQCLWALEQGE